MELGVGTDKEESGPDEGSLRSDVVQGRVGDHLGQSLVGGHGHQSDESLRGVTVAAARGSQAVADLHDAAIWLALEADPTDGPPVGQAGYPVVTERPLLSERGGGAKEAAHCANVALEREIVRPRVGRSRTPSDDTFGLCDVDRMQLEARCPNVSHDGCESALIAEAQRPADRKVGSTACGCVPSNTASKTYTVTGCGEIANRPKPCPGRVGEWRVTGRIVCGPRFVANQALPWDTADHFCEEHQNDNA
jgi:hypothetical protein